MINNAECLDWHILYVKSRQEKKINRALNEQGIETFLPLIKTVKQWSDRKKKVEVPLIPSYIFVKIKSKKEYQEVIDSKHSCFFLKMGSRMAIARQHEIDTIKQFLDLDGITDISAKGAELEVGKSYKVNYGPLKDLECEVYRVPRSNKVKIRIASINQDISATVSSYYFQPIKLKSYSTQTNIEIL